MSPHRITKLAMALVAVVALAGCGKTAPVQQHPSLVDDAMTRGASENARQVVAGQQQQARDNATRGPETTKVPGPGNDQAD